jgi:hypothetical protein
MSEKEKIRDAVLDALGGESSGGPAFPFVLEANNGEKHNVVGMSLRDWFAGQAISGWVSDGDQTVFARQAYQLADAMLRAREGK